MTRLSFLLVSCIALSVGAIEAKSAVIDLIPSNFDKVVHESGKPTFVEFFAPWCGHCKNLAPVYEEFAQAFAFASDKLAIAKMDADEHKSLAKQYNVQGFPTLKFFDGKNDKPEDYNGGRDLESLTAFITEKTGIRPRGPKKAPSNVQILTDSSFGTEVGGDKHVLVAFTAPWCGHCKNLAPVWEILADDFSRDPDIMIAKIDAEAENSKATAKEQAITGFPTIKFFPKNAKEPVVYEGARSEQDFISFLNERTGTHRTVGGGLDDKAGTIEILDRLVAKYLSKKSFSKLVAELQKASKSLQHQYAPYYVKVAEKVSSVEDYVIKELARLRKILDKGGLAPTKSDDVVSRSNILRQFMGEKEPKDEL